MILLNCCGQTYRADEAHIGHSIRCVKCLRVIPISSDIEIIPPATRRPTSVANFTPSRLVKSVVALAVILVLSIAAFSLLSSSRTARSVFQQGNFSFPTPIPTPFIPTVRYASGTDLIPPQLLSGRGMLTISNGTRFDAIVKLEEWASNKTRRSVYVRSFSTADIVKIGAGHFIVKFSLGEGYDPKGERFIRPQTFEKFDELFEFREYKTDGYINWTNFQISLNPVEGGTARTSSISETEFAGH